MIHLVLFSRPGCHLCDEMKAVVEAVAREIPLVLEQVDISGSPELERRYGKQIPVLALDGRTIAVARVTEATLRRVIEERSRREVQG